MMMGTDQKIGGFNVMVNEVQGVDALNTWNLSTEELVGWPPMRFTIYIPFGLPKAR